MQALWQLAVWGATAAATLLVAVLATRSEVGSQRVTVALSSLSGSSVPLLRPGQVAARSFDAEAETRRLSEAVHGLATDNDLLNSRVAAVEHTMDDVTGSIAEQIEAVKTAAAARPPWPDSEPPAPATPAAIAAVVSPVAPPPSGISSPLPPNPLAPLAAASPSIQYGVDIGSALSIQALRARWAGVRSAHPLLFDGLAPIVALKEIPRSRQIELRLVVGPFSNPDAAAQLCASLASYRLYCQPTIFNGQHLALE